MTLQKLVQSHKTLASKLQKSLHDVKVEVEKLAKESADSLSCDDYTLELTSVVVAEKIFPIEISVDIKFKEGDEDGFVLTLRFPEQLENVNNFNKLFEEGISTTSYREIALREKNQKIAEAKKLLEENEFNISKKFDYTCKFDKAWQGACKQPADSSLICEHHKGVKCYCGKQATNECNFAGQFVCGRPLCENCVCSH